MPQACGGVPATDKAKQRGGAAKRLSVVGCSAVALRDSGVDTRPEIVPWREEKRKAEAKSEVIIDRRGKVKHAPKQRRNV